MRNKLECSSLKILSALRIFTGQAVAYQRGAPYNALLLERFPASLTSHNLKVSGDKRSSLLCLIFGVVEGKFCGQNPSSRRYKTFLLVTDRVAKKPSVFVPDNTISLLFPCKAGTYHNLHFQVLPSSVAF